MRVLVSLFTILTLAATTLAQVNSPLTLRFAVADLENRPSTPFVLEFIQQVETLSNGSIAIEPIYQAGDATFAGFETGVVQLVLLGKADLGLAGSRAFDTVGITDFQALQAPFLITDDALAEAVATSDIAARMLDSVSWAGIVGLTLWPEDLRHPFAIMPGQTILSPEDFSGLSVRSPPSFLTYILLEMLGGSPMFGGSDYQAAESGLLQGFSLTGTPTATGNVVFFPKFQVLFAAGAALEGLSEEQRAVLREAATRTQEKAIAEHPKEADAAAQWCADGGSIVMASEEQQAAFEEAAMPVFEEMEQDPLNAEFIAAIRDLKASTEPAPGAEACAPEAAQQPEPAEQPEPDVPTAETGEVWSKGLPPNGIWQVEMSVEDFMAAGVTRPRAREWAGVTTLTVQDGEGLFEWHNETNVDSVKCKITYAVVEDVVRLTYTEGARCHGDIDDIKWRLEEDGLRFHLVATNAPYLEVKTYYETRHWQNVEQRPETATETEVWSEGLPPNGTWQTEVSVEDFLAAGVMRPRARDWAGVWTFALQDGQGLYAWDEEDGESGSCEITYRVVEDVVRFVFPSGDCGPSVTDLKWQLEEDGLRFHLVTTNGSYLEVKTMYETRPWRKID
jgi:TRAP-type C4-dicarboxylate transport system substrate-binding protein